MIVDEASMLTEEALRLPVLEWPQIVERGLWSGSNAEAMKDSLRKHAMHLAAMIGVFGFLAGLGMGLPKLEMLTGKPPRHPEAVKAQIMLGVVCGAFALMCVKSFIDARAARKKAGEGQPSA